MTKKIRFISEYAVHYFKKYFWLILISSTLGSLLYLKQNSLYQIFNSLQSININIGTEGLYTIQTLPSAIANQISHGFTIVSENDRPELSPLIEKLDLGDDNRKYTFTFKDNLIWHNGKKFQSSDINIDIPGVKLETKANNEITIQLNNTFSPLLSSLNKPIFLNKSLIGLGPYRINNLVYKDGYINLLSLTSIDDSKQKITYHFYPNTQDLVNAFKLGEVDKIAIDTLDQSLNQWPNIEISQQISTNKYLAVFFNTEKLNIKQLRQAISYATPKTNDKNDRCLGPISPNSWAYNPQIKAYNTNITRAKELYEKNTVKIIKLAVSDRALLKTAEKIKNSWENTFKTKVELTTINRHINLSDYDAFLAYGFIPTDPDQYSFWHSTQISTNITRLNNSRIDKLLEEGRQTQDQAERKRIYQDFQKFLLEEAPAVFIKFPTTYTITRVKYS